VWVELTEKGEKVVEILQATRVDFWSDLLSHLSEEERDQYFHIMKKISQKLQQ
jgi:DNA-binding MarR family transcriptional regulator